MRKLIVALLVAVFAGPLLAQQITNVRLSPAKSSYNAGEQVTIKWDYTGLSIPSTALVKITLWREGNSQNICKIAENISISTGTSGYQWTVPSTCTNPHTGATEDLTRGRLWIRVRWQRHSVWGESEHFTISSAPSGEVSLSNLRIVPSREGYYPLQPVEIRWDYTGPSRPRRIRLYVVEGNHDLCEISQIVYAQEKHLEWHIGEGCVDASGHRVELPRDRNLKIRANIGMITTDSSPFRVYSLPLKLSVSLRTVGRTNNSLKLISGSTSSTRDIYSFYEYEYEALLSAPYQIVARVVIENQSNQTLSGTLECTPHSTGGWCRSRPFNIRGNVVPRYFDVPMEISFCNLDLYCRKQAKYSWTISAKDSSGRKLGNDLSIRVNISVPSSLCQKARIAAIATDDPEVNYLEYEKGYISGEWYTFEFKAVGTKIEKSKADIVILPVIKILTATNIWDTTNTKACLIFDPSLSRNYAGVDKSPYSRVGSDRDSASLFQTDKEGYVYEGKFYFITSKENWWRNLNGRDTHLYYYAFLAPSSVRCADAFREREKRFTKIEKVHVITHFEVPSEMTGGWRW